MIAVAKVGGHQAIVSVGDIISIDKIDTEVGKKVSFEVLLVSEADGKNFQMGAPILEGVTVEAKVIEHGRDDKIRVYKMKPRKRYRRTQGHRQDFTTVEITAIKTGKAAPAPKKAAAAKPAKTEKTETKATKTAAKKAASPKKVAPKEEKA